MVITCYFFLLNLCSTRYKIIIYNYQYRISEDFWDPDIFISNKSHYNLFCQFDVEIVQRVKQRWPHIKQHEWISFMYCNRESCFVSIKTVFVASYIISPEFGGLHFFSMHISIFLSTRKLTNTTKRSRHNLIRNV